MSRQTQENNVRWFKKKKSMEKGSKELKEKEKDKMFSLLEIDLVAFLLYEFI